MIAALGAFGLKALGLLKLVPVWAWVALALVSAIGVQTVRLQWAKHDLVTANAEADKANDAAMSAYATIHIQNLAVTKLKADGAAREAALTASLAKAAPVAARHQAKAADLAVYTPKGDDALAQLVDLDAEIAR